MYLGIEPQRSCARAWAAAASELLRRGDEGYNIIIDIQQPEIHDGDDNEVIALVDRFLRRHGKSPVITVANTIFPQSLYLAHGSPAFYGVYHRDFDRLSETKRWGRYFERMTRHRKEDGGTYNPLIDLIDKMKRQEEVGVRYSSAYELAVYDPLRDGRSLYGGPCLSFVSFKIHKQRGLLLTAIYRNHAYITRCLGNLIGLGRLQAFVAKEAGVNVGSLTVVSTHATLDTDRNWGIKDARGLVAEACRTLGETVKSAAPLHLGLPPHVPRRAHRAQSRQTIRART